MTNEELKKKMIKILRCFEGRADWLAEEISDALIKAGLKFDTVVSHTATFDLSQMERINKLESQAAEAEHRARVAERAVYNLAYGEWQREGARRAICEKYAPSTARDYLARAEKELAEEKTR